MATNENLPDEQLVKIGQCLRELRIKKGYTNYEQFAFDNNISRAQYGRYEKGQDMRLSSLLKVLQALQTTPEEFFKMVLAMK
jgi:transcriptional regulator with XRE-family HTH domain